MSVQDYVSIQNAQIAIAKSVKDKGSKAVKHSSGVRSAKGSSSNEVSKRWKFDCADLTQRDGGYGDRPVVTFTASIHQAKQEIDRFAEFVMILRRKIDNIGRLEEIYAYARDAKRTRVERKHMKVLTSFMRIHLRDTVREYRRLVPNGLISYDFLNTLFRPGEVVVSHRDEIKECYLVQEADEREKDGERHMQIKCYSWAYNGTRFGPYLNRLTIDSFTGVRKINQLNVYPISQLLVEERKCLTESLRARGLKWRSLVDMSHREYDGVAHIFDRGEDTPYEEVSTYIKGRVVLDYKTFVQSNPGLAMRLENTGAVIDVENEVTLDDGTLERDDDTEDTEKSDDSLDDDWSDEAYSDDSEYGNEDDDDDGDEDDDEDENEDETEDRDENSENLLFNEKEIKDKAAEFRETEGDEVGDNLQLNINSTNQICNNGKDDTQLNLMKNNPNQTTVTGIEHKFNDPSSSNRDADESKTTRQENKERVKVRRHQEETNILKSYLACKTYVPSDLQALLCPGKIPGFSLVEKEWGYFALDKISHINWTEGVFEQLEIDPSSKNAVRSLVQMHQSDGSAFDDIIAGKGKGLIFLLFGPPGCGKTLTAETIAEHTRKPLYWVTSGELGTDIETTETRLRTIFGLAKAWDAILLLDEADVFLAKRTHADMTRNAFVSIFLRSIEYYQGVLFLTTNRREEFDDAFQSRIHLTLEYPPLDIDKKACIWRNLLQKRPVPESWDIQQYRYFGKKYDLNGREIKNLISTALAIAKHGGHVLDEETIDIVYALNQKTRLPV